MGFAMLRKVGGIEEQLLTAVNWDTVWESGEEAALVAVDTCVRKTTAEGIIARPWRIHSRASIRLCRLRREPLLNHLRAGRPTPAHWRRASCANPGLPICKGDC